MSRVGFELLGDIDHLRSFLELDQRAIAGEALAETGEIAAKAARARLAQQGSVDSGRGERSISSRPKRWNRVEVGSPVFYLSFVEYGTDPHVIKARRKKALTPGTTDDALVRKVQHPGARPMPFLRPSLRDVFPEQFMAIWSRKLSGLI